jgi:hypothetical protein
VLDCGLYRAVSSRRRLAVRVLWLLTSIACCYTPFMVCQALAQTPDPKPPQLSVSFFDEPSVLMQEGSPRLVYEMLITNYPPSNYVVDSVDIGGSPAAITFSGTELTDMMRILGVSGPRSASERIEGGRSAVVYIMLAFESRDQVPTILMHTLHITASDGSKHALTTAPLRVSPRQAVIVGAPLRGTGWIAGDASHNGPDAAHRRAILLLGGKAWLAQRYAIDWVRYRIINGKAVTWSGAEENNASYLCYGEPILSVADGKVVEVLDGIPENVPHSGKYAVDINFISAGGNHVVADIGGGNYVLYAHMRPRSLTVKLGEHVTQGQILGVIGNSGSSTEPHLHLHVVDHPSFLGGQGVPYEFANFSASKSTEMLAAPHERMFFRPFGPLRPFHNDYPANNAAVAFP